MPVLPTPRTPGDRYCEVDGYDFERPGDRSSSGARSCVPTGPASSSCLPTTWSSPTTRPRSPVRSTPSRCRWDGRARRGIIPDIDLAGSYEDPGVSRRHLRFDRLPDGGYAVVDCGSANGTTINDDPTPIRPDTPVPLAEGDRVHLGAWTTITIVRQPTEIQRLNGHALPHDRASPVRSALTRA